MLRALLLKGVIAGALAAAAATPASADAPDRNLSTTAGFVSGSAPAEIVSPIDNGYRMMAAYIASHPTRYRFAVGHIVDQTGKFSNEASAGGFQVTQGMTSEVYSALDKLGLRTVERTDTDIANFDIGVWKQSLLGDANFPGVVGPDGKLVINPKTGQPEGRGIAQYRGGQIQSVDFYVTGAITGISYSVHSGGFELSIQNIGGGKRTYSMDVDMDLRIVNAHTLEVVKAIPVHKVVWGYETEAGIYNFLGKYLINFNAGSKAQEPRELAIRAAMEDALLVLVGAVMPTQDGRNYGLECAHYGETTYGDVRTLADTRVRPSSPAVQTPEVAPKESAAKAAPPAPPKTEKIASNAGLLMALAGSASAAR